MTRAWNKEKIRVSDRNRTHDFPNTGRVLYPLSYENSRRAMSFNWVHVWQVSWPSLFIYHNLDDFNSADPSSTQDACHTSTQLNNLALCEFS